MVRNILFALVAFTCISCEARDQETTTTTTTTRKLHLREQQQQVTITDRRLQQDRDTRLALSGPIIEDREQYSPPEKTKRKRDLAKQVKQKTSRNNNKLRQRNLLVNGEIANPEDYPYFGFSSMDESNPDLPLRVCGGSLIHSDIFLTSAHCQGAFLYGINFYDPTTRNYTREVQVFAQHRHPNFNLDNDKINFDILVRIQSFDTARNCLSVMKGNYFGRRVAMNRLTNCLFTWQILQLAEPIDDIEPVITDDGSTILTHGDVLESLGVGSEEYQGLLPTPFQNATFEYIDNEHCDGQVRNVDYGDDIICANPIDGSSICQGDSGGPLLTLNGAQVGVVSFTVLCEPDSIADGFARLSYFDDWIQTTICDLSQDAPIGCIPSPPPPSDAIEVEINFRFDFFPEETTYAIRKQVDGSIAHVGPTYVPGRGETWSTSVFLLPGQYSFEVYDTYGDGLMGAVESIPHGSWEIIAVYGSRSDDEVRIAIGIPGFESLQNTSFEVAETIEGPTNESTNNPASIPTQSPTLVPTVAATTSPTIAPSESPIILPTLGPTSELTEVSTKAPTTRPVPATSSPTQTRETVSPTMAPTSVTSFPAEPTGFPIIEPFDASTSNSSIVWVVSMVGLIFICFLGLTLYVCKGNNKTKQVLDVSRHDGSIHEIIFNSQRSLKDLSQKEMFWSEKDIEVEA